MKCEEVYEVCLFFQGIEGAFGLLDIPFTIHIWVLTFEQFKRRQLHLYVFLFRKAAEGVISLIYVFELGHSEVLFRREQLRLQFLWSFLRFPQLLHESHLPDSVHSQQWSDHLVSACRPQWLPPAEIEESTTNHRLQTTEYLSH